MFGIGVGVTDLPVLQRGPIGTPTLATLTLSGTLTNGSTSSGTIYGATAGSTIVSNVTGLTVNSGARTYTWDGSGAAGTTANGLVETLAGATGSPKSTSLTVAASGIPAPVITQTSTAGAQPFTWSVAENAAYFPGDYWEVARTTGASTAAASTALVTATPDGVAPTYASLNGYALQQITEGDLVDSSAIVFTDLAVAPTGALALRLRVGQEDGSGGTTWGPWSNVLTDTIAASSTALLAASSGVNKSQYIDTTGSPRLTATMNNDLGALCSVRATQTATGKAHFEVTLNSFSSQSNNMGIGVADSSLALGPATFVRPGKGSDSGCSINIAHGSTTIDLYVNGGYFNSYSLIGGGVPQIGDLFIVEFDTSAKTVSMWHSRSGTHLALFTTTITSGIPTNWSAQVGGLGSSGGSGPDSMTVNFGATTFAKTPTAGYSLYG